jgi:hypothetical protein
MKRIIGDVVYVCDNDTAGKRAGRAFSRHYAGPMEVVMFDERFKRGFDLADPVPEGIDLRLSDLMRSATWATKIVGKKRGGNSVFGLTDGFANEWVHVDDPELYINVRRPWGSWRHRSRYCSAALLYGVQTVAPQKKQRRSWPQPSRSGQRRSNTSIRGRLVAMAAPMCVRKAKDASDKAVVDNGADKLSATRASDWLRLRELVDFSRLVGRQLLG